MVCTQRISVYLIPRNERGDCNSWRRGAVRGSNLTSSLCSRQMDLSRHHRTAVLRLCIFPIRFDPRRSCVHSTFLPICWWPIASSFLWQDHFAIGLGAKLFRPIKPIWPGSRSPGTPENFNSFAVRLYTGAGRLAQQPHTHTGVYPRKPMQSYFICKDPPLRSENNIYLVGQR